MECEIIMEDLLSSVIVQYIVVGTYEVTMVWEYHGSVQIFRSMVVFSGIPKIFRHQKQVATK